MFAAYENELGLEAILELNLGVGQDLGSASTFPNLAVNLRLVHLLSTEDEVDLGPAFDHADEGDVRTHIGDQGGHGKPTVHEQVLGLMPAFSARTSIGSTNSVDLVTAS